ncbi:hypothetical protein [Streptomyces sp. x-80]|uniref:hypothetical protein n=1 Tax=Streptomyces sp. x-80 TaxID=2789282 RepID=UPI00397F5C03
MFRTPLSLIHSSRIQHTELSGRVLPAIIGNIAQDGIQHWARIEEKGAPDPGGPDPETPEKWLRCPAAPKRMANRHRLLFRIVRAAVESDRRCAPRAAARRRARRARTITERRR